MSIIEDKDKIDLDELINEFVQMVSDDSEDLSTDPNVRRVKVIRALEECGCCGRQPPENWKENLNKE